MKKILAFASASLLFLGAGCVPTPQSLMQGAIENKINAELKGDATVDLDDNGITINDDDEGTTASFGENVKLPDNFPEEIPVLDGAKIVGVTVTLKEGSWISLITDKTVEEAAGWYDAKLLGAGWTVSGSYTAGGMTTKMYENGSFNLTVIVSAGEDGGPTGVMVTETVVN